MSDEGVAKPPDRNDFTRPERGLVRAQVDHEEVVGAAVEPRTEDSPASEAEPT